MGAMRLLTLTLYWCLSTWCPLATSRRFRGPSHSPHRHGKGGRQGRAWEPGGLRQLRRLQDHGVNLEHLGARVHTRSNRNHPSHLGHLGVSAGVQAQNFPQQTLDVSRLARLDAFLCLIGFLLCIRVRCKQKLDGCFLVPDFSFLLRC